MPETQHVDAAQYQVPVLGGVAPYIQVEGAMKAAEFYKAAFAAEQAGIYPPDETGRTMHVHLYINGGSVMLSDAYPEHGHPHQPAAGYSLHLQVEDADFWWERAVKAGCAVTLPLQLMFWGDRYGQLKDPFGISWSIAMPGGQS